eukprot:scaffold4044_cov78-Phaeocystis_antarctica.AAC.5
MQLTRVRYPRARVRGRVASHARRRALCWRTADVFINGTWLRLQGLRHWGAKPARLLYNLC